MFRNVQDFQSQLLKSALTPAPTNTSKTSLTITVSHAWMDAQSVLVKVRACYGATSHPALPAVSGTTSSNSGSS